MMPRSDVPKDGPPPARGLAGLVLLMAGIGVILYAWVGDRSGTNRPAPTSSAPPAAQSSASPVPPFHADPESAKPFPALLDPARFQTPVVSRAYAIARSMPEVLAQQPCYCNCQVFGHGSLLDCFASDHGAT